VPLSSNSVFSEVAPGISLTAVTGSEKPQRCSCFHFLHLEWSAPFFSGAYGGSAAMIRGFPDKCRRKGFI
jgi:hypothetical protein